MFNPTRGRVHTGALLVFAPALRRWIARLDYPRRVRAIRRLLPGDTEQIPNELVRFAQFAATRNPSTICEIGTLNGGTSLVLCGLSPSVRTFVGIDLNPCNDRVVPALAPRRVDVRFLKGSSREEEMRRRVASMIGRSIDLLFIDGDHRYEAVRDDLLDYRELVRPGGLIALHDIVPDQAGRLGVPRLWRETRDQFRHWEFVQSWDQEGLGIGIIEHDPSVTL
jgi:predicted O-methyltransferase YrrM